MEQTSDHSGASEPGGKFRAGPDLSFLHGMEAVNTAPVMKMETKRRSGSLRSTRG